MKLFAVYLFRFVAVMAVTVIIAGCAMTMTIKTKDIPQLQTGSPLKSINPKRFAFKEFKDIRGREPSLVGKIKALEFNLDMPAATVLAAAIKRELERNGHACVADTPESKANFIIEGAVYKYWLKEDASFSAATIIGNVAVKLTVSSVSDEKKVMTKSYEGEYYLSAGFGVRPGSCDAVLNQALLGMVKEISTDPELIAFIEK